MKVLKYHVSGQRITPSQSYYDYILIKGTQNYIALSFTFSESWGNIPRAVSFNNGADYEPLNEDFCIVPAEILENDTFTFSVIGSDGSTTITTNTITLTQEGGVNNG